MQILLWAIGLYLLYKLIFDFILPVYRTTNRVRKQFRDVQSRMNEQFQGQQRQQGPSSSQQQRPAQKPVVGDYIDFEEIKK